MAQHDTYIGKEIGNYRIEQEIASGSFGTVYLARHLHLKQRTVVIKILHALRLGSAEEKEQFLQEAQILETLKGLPNILPLLDVGIDGSLPYQIAEYAEHGSLRMYMQQHGIPLPVPEALRIIEQVGHGLANAHNQGIIHRDLKPENILFNAKGEALLADFGLSTVLSTASVTYTRVEGTPAYMAPEQFDGEVSKASDQYALACIAYELLTGQKLFEAPSFVAMGFLHTTKAPTPPRQLNPDIPASVEHALLRALSKDRTERYPGISAFIAALNTPDDLATLLPAQRSPLSPPSPPTLPATGHSRTLPQSSTLPNMPPPVLHPPIADMEATSAMANPVASRTHPRMPSRAPVWSPPSPYTPPARRTGPAPLLIALLIIMLLVLGGSILAVIGYFDLFLPTGPSSSSATITITPLSKTVQDTYVMHGVTSNANPNNHEVSVRQLTSTKTATQQVQLTHFHQDAVAATGKITFFNAVITTQTLKAPITFQVGNVQIVTDQDAVMPPRTTTQEGQTTVTAHAVQAGAAGNIAALAIDQRPCCGTQIISAQNQIAFTGGTDVVNYNYLKQDGVNAVTTADQNTLTTSAQNDIKAQIKTGEQLLADITCNDPQTTEDIQPDTHQPTNVTTAHVTVSVTCNAQVYDANVVQTIARNALKQKASQDPGAGYILVGQIVTQSQPPQVQQNGSIRFPVTASGIWYYQWTDAMKQDLLNQIKGISKTQAQTILNTYPGISNATIDVTNSRTTLPNNVSQITLKLNTPSGGSNQTPTPTTNP